MTRGVRRALAMVLVARQVGLAAPATAPAQAIVPRPLVMPFGASRAPTGSAKWRLSPSRGSRAAGVGAISGASDRLRAMDRLRVPSVPLLSHATVIRLARRRR